MRLLVVLCGTPPASTEISSHVAWFLYKSWSKAGSREDFTAVIVNSYIIGLLGFMFALTVLSFKVCRGISDVLKNQPGAVGQSFTLLSPVCSVWCGHSSLSTMLALLTSIGTVTESDCWRMRPFICSLPERRLILKYRDGGDNIWNWLVFWDLSVIAV